MGIPSNPMPPFIASLIRVGGMTLFEHYERVRDITENNKIQNICEVNADAELDEAKTFAQSIVPVLTGYLRSTIDWEKIGRFLYRFFASADYARHVEEGTIHQRAQPYMMPALIRLKQRLPEVIIRDITQIFK
jgi:HK97 gp10 family phage protein